MEKVIGMFEKRFKHSKGTIQNVAILVVVYGFEEFIRTQFFRCPCSNYAMYSLVMLTSPAFFLVGLSFMMSGGFWQVFFSTGSFQHCKERCNYRMRSLTKIFQPFLAPIAFVTFALLRGDFFVCSKGGALKDCEKYNTEEETSLKMDLLRLHMQSQILGVGLLVAVTLFALGLVCIRRCCFEDDVLPSIDEYDDLEREIVGRLFRAKLQAAVEEDTKKKINDVFQVRSHKDLRNAFYRAKQLLPCAYPEKRNGRYNRLSVDEDEAELNFVDSTQL